MVAFAVALLASSASAPPADPAADLFKPAGPVPRVRVAVDEANLKMLLDDDRKPVRGKFKVDEESSLRDIGLHLKGAAGSKRGWEDKPGLTLSPGKFVKGQTFRGLDKFHLNNGTQDGSFFNELLANELAAAAGLPACRCAHATVELNGHPVGLYVLKEGFGKAWLRRHFADPSGNLYDGGFVTDIDGELKLDSGTDNGREDLKAVVAACQEPDADKRYAAVGKLVDVDRFAALAALQIVTADWDGYCRKPNNYRVYFDPKTGKAVFVPHGMDQMWQNPEEELWPEWNGMVAKAILGHPQGRAKTIAKLKRMAETDFTVEKMHGRIDALFPRAKEAVAKQNKDWAIVLENEVNGLKGRIEQRAKFLAAELPKLK